MEIKLSDRQLYLLIRISYVISLEICLGKSLPQRLMDQINWHAHELKGKILDLRRS
uniref:Uncharacterized protein n=1 Tax=Oryza sativa subsp. japonica TaxID=39947 RepID=Q8H8Q4_ORYSJ|nr:hypothetical protein [Oryza sativa Japonica Group]